MNKDGKLFINSASSFRPVSAELDLTAAFTIELQLYKDSEHLDVIVATAIAMEGEVGVCFAARPGLRPSHTLNIAYRMAKRAEPAGCGGSLMQQVRCVVIESRTERSSRPRLGDDFSASSRG